MDEATPPLFSITSEAARPKSGRIRSLYIRPLRSADLCFGVPGILEARPANVGDLVKAFSLQTEVLIKLTPATDSAEIRSWMNEKFLANLRTPAAAAALDRGVLQRKLADLSRYKHKDKIVESYKAAYSGPDNKMDRLDRLTKLEHDRAKEVDEAYNRRAELQGAILGADTSKVHYEGNQTTDTFIASLGSQTTTSTAPGVGASNDTTPDLKPSYSIPISWQYDPDPIKNKWVNLTNHDPVFHSQKTNITIPDQIIHTKFTDLRDMQKENQIRNETARIGLRSQILSETLPSAAASEMDDILKTQEAALTEGLRVAQITFASLFLLPPFEGRVTHVFKEEGEAVAANEPVIRIEAPDEALLVGLIRYRDPLSVGKKVSIVINDVFDDGGRVTLEGRFVAVRGHNSVNDEWEVMIRAKNKDLDVTNSDGTVRGRIALPLNYHFDRHRTEFTILPD